MSTEAETFDHVTFDKLPKHVAIIMDGNGRWAEGQSLSRNQGHIAGVRRVEEIVDECKKVQANLVGPDTVLS